MLELLGEHEIEWRSVDVFQVDERVAPEGDRERNLTRLRESLPPEAASSLRPMPVEDRDLDAAAERYAASLPPALDLLHLGLGPDGHTASLVPGDPVLEEADRRVATTGVYAGRRRMTLTYPALEAARRTLWLVIGADKREALAALLAGDRSIPAGRLRCRDALVLCDAAAADDHVADQGGREEPVLDDARDG
jgi:6-phosphogluconolactonase/glucosamine-6-phosphate isomerase/deaminase